MASTEAAPEYGLADMLCTVPSAVAEELVTRNLWVRAPTSTDRFALLEAEKLILHITDLWFVVIQTVGGIAPLSNVNDDFDVSHSEPALGNTILLSIPPEGPLTGLRLSEEVVHEAMHINLSKYEEAIPLVKSFALMFSPWRSTPREARGVLHGLYVFSCVAQFMSLLLEFGELSAIERTHVCRRLREIVSDLTKIDEAHLVSNLTTKGAALANALLCMGKARR